MALPTFGFVDDVTFSHNIPVARPKWRQNTTSMTAAEIPTKFCSTIKSKHSVASCASRQSLLPMIALFNVRRRSAAEEQRLKIVKECHYVENYDHSLTYSVV